MKEFEIRRLFLEISNCYNFAFDDYKVNLWLEILRDIPFALAMKNLRSYIRDPENKFPPHPGVLAQTDIQKSAGPYIPSAAETRLMLEEGKRQVIPLPKHVREEVEKLAAQRDSSS